MFPCTKCGCCCKRIGVVIQELNMSFPYKVRENGACEMLTKDNRCKVYDNRPTICNVDAFQKMFNLNKEEFYKQNIEACNTLMEIDNVSQELRIKI